MNFDELLEASLAAWFALVGFAIACLASGVGVYFMWVGVPELKAFGAFLVLCSAPFWGLGISSAGLCIEAARKVQKPRSQE